MLSSIVPFIINVDVISPETILDDMRMVFHSNYTPDQI